MLTCNIQMTVLPMDTVYHIRSFMRWRDCTILISREWLHGALRRRIRLRTWRGRVRVYSYLRVFGQAFVQMHWRRLCIQLGISRRARNIQDRLSWKAAVKQYMCRHCKACGRSTRACVLGLPICVRCRFDPTCKYAYMVMTRDAKRMGIPKRILDTIPYHRYGQMRLRFLHELTQ